MEAHEGGVEGARGLVGRVVGELASFAPAALPSLHFLLSSLETIKGEFVCLCGCRNPIDSCCFPLPCMLQLASLQVWVFRMGSFSLQSHFEYAFSSRVSYFNSEIGSSAPGIGEGSTLA
jgi:hypothetical protein